MGIVFIGMETSGALRRRFQAAGHFTISCDLLPAEDGSKYPESINGRPMGGHIQGDVFRVLDYLWAGKLWPTLAIFHPTCTYLTASAEWAFKDADFERYPGVGYHQRPKPDTLLGAARRRARDEAVDQFRRLMALPIRRKVFENPVGVIGTRVRRASQLHQPYLHGDDASKTTLTWYVDKDGNEAPELIVPVDPARRKAGRLVEWPRGSGTLVERWANQSDSGQNNASERAGRWKDRSRTFEGMADSWVAHWSKFV